jgi:hypothetical protein
MRTGFLSLDESDFLRIAVHLSDDFLVLSGMKSFDPPQKLHFSTKIKPGYSILLVESSIAVVSPEELSFTLIRTGESRGLANPASSTKFVAASGIYVVCGNVHGYFYVFESMFPKFWCTVLPHSPLCAHLSSARKLFAVGTDSALVLVFGLEKGRFFRLLDLHGHKPSRILISEEFGFIVVFSQNRLIGFTENGTEMYNVDFPFEVARSVTFSFVDGADFAVFSTDQNEMFVFEIFAPKPRKWAEFGFPIVDFVYSKLAHGIFTLTADGALHFGPFNPTN